MSIIPDCIKESALAADRKTEQELTDKQKRNFELWVTIICVAMLWSAAIGTHLWHLHLEGLI